MSDDQDLDMTSIIMSPAQEATKASIDSKLDLSVAQQIVEDDEGTTWVVDVERGVPVKYSARVSAIPAIEYIPLPPPPPGFGEVKFDHPITPLSRKQVDEIINVKSEDMIDLFEKVTGTKVEVQETFDPLGLFEE